MNKNIVEEIRKFVEEKCRNHNLGEEIYFNHFIPVVNYSKKLAKEKEVNLELVEIAAWLHDIGSIVYGRKNHHITGAKIAEEKLNELCYDKDKIELIKKCILNHRGSVKNILSSDEEQIIVEADCLTFFDHLEGYFLWVIDGDGIKNQKSIRESVKQKLQNKWNQLSPNAKELIKLKYEAAMLLFS
jgi:uncharacterized protein